MSGDAANDISLTSIPKGENPVAFVSFNKDGYSKYCKDYGEYWAWVKERNPERYANNIANEKNYDAKNMMHVFRLLNMAEEIAREGIIRVRRPERDFLLNIRSGAMEYEDLVKMAEEKALMIDALFEKSDLPDEPSKALGEQFLVEIREDFYGR
jgi:uncharacterized protein